MATGAEHGLKKIVWQSKFIESKQLIFCKLLARTVQCFFIYMSSTQRKSCQKFKETHLVCWVCSEELQSPYEVVWVFVLEFNKETVRCGLCPVCLRYVCLGNCLACVIESLFPLAALLMLACPALLHCWVLTLAILQELFVFNGERVHSWGLCMFSWRDWVFDVIKNFSSPAPMCYILWILSVTSGLLCYDI